jgi:transmembrane sensor
MATLHRPDRNLLIRYFKAETTAEEVALIELYLALDIDHAFVMQCLKEAQHGFDDDRRLHLNQTQLDSAWQEFQLRKAPSGSYSFNRTYWKYAVAAAVAILVVSTLFIRRERPANSPAQNQYAAVTSYQKIEAPHGRLRKVTLPDGSKVTLFPGTSISYPNTYNLHNRSLIVAGKAYFDVKQAADKPFYVSSGDMTTRVLGTAFEINTAASDNRQTVTLNSGKVKVEYGPQELGLLARDEQMLVSATGDFTVRKINTTQHVAWIQEQLNYELAPLADICADLALWYDVNIDIHAAALKSKKLTASFTRQPLSNVLDILSRTGAFKYKIAGKSVIIY